MSIVEKENLRVSRERAIFTSIRMRLNTKVHKL